MAKIIDNSVDPTAAAPKLKDGVLGIDAIEPVGEPGSRVFIHYNGPTDQMAVSCTGMAVLDPGASPHPIHQHPEEEYLIVAIGTGEIQCGGKSIKVGPGSIMYCDGNVPHGITNTGKVPMTFYWSKWMAKNP